MVIVILILVLICSVLIAAEKKESKSVDWQTDYSKSEKTAQKAKKLMMVDFFTEWCICYKRLDQETYKDTKVVKLSRKFVRVKVDGDKHSNLAQKYRVSIYPTIIIFNSKGKESNRIV